MTPQQFVSQLGGLRFADAFNPYSERCSVYDQSDAPKQRSELLIEMLELAARSEIDAIWIGRDLGFRGGRRTGMALTDDVHFHDHLSRWGISKTKPTMGAPVSERTATVVWELLARIDVPVFLWNVFPLHPHGRNDPFTNRAHNARERKAGIELLTQLIQLLQPKRLIAVGNDAEQALDRISTTATAVKVRHPSYGGQTKFARQMSKLYDIKQTTLL